MKELVAAVREHGIGIGPDIVKVDMFLNHRMDTELYVKIGQAFAEAVGEKRGISRYGSIVLPMDETLILSSVDISGRAHLTYDLHGLNPTVGGMDTELVKEFFIAFAREAKITLHVRKLSGKNTHHIIEAAFKSVGHSLAAALSNKAGLEGAVLSTKEVL